MARAGRIRDLERRWEGGMEAGGARAGESVRANEGRWRQRRGVPTPLAPTPDALSRVLRPRPTFSQPNSQNRLLQEVPRLLPEVMTFITHRQRDVRTDREKKSHFFYLFVWLSNCFCRPPPFLASPPFYLHIFFVLTLFLVHMK